MFGLKAGRRAGHHALHRRVYLNVDVIKEGKRLASTVTPPWSRRFQLEDEDEKDVVCPSTRTLCIRMSRPLAGGMVDAFSVIRGVERKFGRIREYRFIRDGEFDSEYQMLCWAAFQSEESMNLIPEEGINLSVPAAAQDPTMPVGGPGLEHLQGLLDAQGVNPPSTSVDSASIKPRMIELNVQRAASDLRFKGESSPLNLTRARRIAIGHSFYEWGGFYPLKPLFTSSPFVSQSEEPLPTPDHEQMRIALNKWSQILNRPDPSFSQMKDTAKEESQATNQVEDPVTADPEPPSDSSMKLSQKSRRKTRREVDAWVPLSTPLPTQLSSPDTIPIKKITTPRTFQPSTPKTSRKERLLEQARSQAREQILGQVALRAREATSTDLNSPGSKTLRESVELLLKHSKVDAKSQGDVTKGSGFEVGPKAGDKPVGENSAAPAKDKLWNLVEKWF